MAFLVACCIVVGLIGIGVSMYCMHLVMKLEKMKSVLKEKSDLLTKKDELLKSKEQKVQEVERLSNYYKEQFEIKERELRSLRFTLPASFPKIS